MEDLFGAGVGGVAEWVGVGVGVVVVVVARLARRVVLMIAVVGWVWKLHDVVDRRKLWLP